MRSGAFSEHEHEHEHDREDQRGRGHQHGHERGRAGAVGSGRWRVSPGFTALKCTVTVVLVLAAVFLAEDRASLSAAVVAAVVAGGYALRDVLAPVRLAADGDGITVVSGYAGHRQVGWAQVERIRVEARSRGGLRSELLEIDTGDTLHLLSNYDLNARPVDVAEKLERIRTAGGGD